MKLFSISCLTCQARLAVREASAIGQILACPKCGSMVEVRPPPGWTPPAETAASPAAEHPNQPASPPVGRKSPARNPAADSPRRDPRQAADDRAHRQRAAEAQALGLLAICDTGLDLETAPVELARWSPGFSRFRLPNRWQTWSAWGGGAAAAVAAIAAGVWLAVSAVGPVTNEPTAGVPPIGKSSVAAGDVGPSGVNNPTAPAPLELVTTEVDESPPAESSADDVAAQPLDVRWLPDDAASIVSLRTAALADDSDQSLAAPFRAALIDPLCETLRVAPGEIRRLTWSTADLAAGLDRAVVALELVEPMIDDATLLFDCQPQDFDVGDAVAYRRDGPWPHPFALIDERTIVTGPADLLPVLATRTADPVLPPSIEQLLETADAADHLTALVDLAALRTAAPSFRLAAAGAWPAADAAWKIAGQSCDGLRVLARADDDSSLSGELWFVCDDPSSADPLRTALETLLDNARAASAGPTSDGQTNPTRQQGPDTNPTRQQGHNPLAAAAQHAETGIDGPAVWVRTHWLAADAGPSAAIAAALPAWSAQVANSSPDTTVNTDDPSLATYDVAAADAAIARPATASPSNPRPRPAPRPSAVVDAPARMADALARLDCQALPLADYIDLLSSLCTVPIALDLDALSSVGVSPRDPVTVDLTDATVGEALDAAIGPAGLQWRIEGGQVVVVGLGPAADKPIDARYDTAPLLSTGETADDLAQLVQSLVAPQTWSAEGGDGTIAVQGAALVVSQPPAVQRQVRAFFDQLAAARRHPASPAHAPDDPWAATQALLDRPVTVNFHLPTPLRQITGWLREPSGATIVIDWLALRGQGVAPPAELTVTAANRPLAEALAGLLDPANLAVRAVDERTLQITSREITLTRSELRFHPAGDLVATAVSDNAASDDAGDELLDRLRTELPDADWNTGAAHFDPPSGFLLLRAPEPLHAQVRALLARWRAAR